MFTETKQTLNLYLVVFKCKIYSVTNYQCISYNLNSDFAIVQKYIITYNCELCTLIIQNYLQLIIRLYTYTFNITYTNAHTNIETRLYDSSQY